MKAKTRGILLAFSLLMLAALHALSLLSEKAGCQNLLMVTMRGWSLSGQSLEDVEDFCEDKFLLTYEITENATVKAVNSAHSVSLLGTNSVYLDVMGYRLLDGCFFTKSAWDSKSRQAVLNEAAAFTVFGSSRISGNTMQINGETWAVVGVIRDNDTENLNLYVPSSIKGGRVQPLMAMMGPDGSGTGEAHIINELKSLGIHDTNSDFTNLSRAESAFTEQFWVALKAMLCAAAILVGKKWASWIAKRLSYCKNKLKQVYLRELIADHRTEPFKICAVALLLLVDIGTVLYFMLQILETCLAWQELSLPEQYLLGDFAKKLTWIYNYQAIGTALFLMFILTVIIIFALSWNEKPLISFYTNSH